MFSQLFSTATAPKPSIRPYLESVPLPVPCTHADPSRRYTLGTVWGAAFSPDGTKFVTAGPGGVFLCEVPGGRVQRTLGEPGYLASCPTFSPDGRRLITVLGPEMRLWDVQTGECIRTLYSGSVCRRNPVFSPDGNYILTADYDGGINYISLWNSNSGARLRTYAMPHQHDLQGAAFAPDGKCFVTTEETGGGPLKPTKSTLRLWDTYSATCLRVYPAIRGHMAAAVFSADGKRILTAGGISSEDFSYPNPSRGEVRSWDVASAKCHGVQKLHDRPLTFIALSRDGRRVLTGDGCQARLWSSDLSKRLALFPGSPLDYCPDGRRVLTRRDEDLCLWDTGSGPSPETVREFCASPFYALSVTDPRILTVAGTGSSMQLWDVASGTRLLSYPPVSAPNPAITGAALSPDGKHLFATVIENGGGFLWATDSTTPLMTFPEAAGAVAFSPDCKTILTGCGDGSLRLWMTESGALRRTYKIEGVNLTGDNSEFSSLCFSADGKRFLSLTGRDTALLWDVASASCLASYHAEGELIGAIALSAEGDRAVLGCAGGRILVWDTHSDALARTIEAQEFCQEDIFSIALSPDGQLILTGGPPVCLWDADSGKCLRVMRAHNASVGGVAFSSNGSKAYSAGEDGLLLQWNVAAPSLVGGWDLG